MNVSAHCSKNTSHGYKEASLLFPHIANIQEAIFILNPNYFVHEAQIQEYLKRMGYRVIKEVKKVFNESDAADLLFHRYKETDYVDELINFFKNRNTILYYVQKMGALHEINAIFEDENPSVDDIFTYREFKLPLQPGHFPYLFVMMDTPEMFEQGLAMMLPQFARFWGEEVAKMSAV